MPELPEVETMRRGIAAVVDQEIVVANFTRSRYRPIQVLPSRAMVARRVQHQVIQSLDRRGKRILLRLSSGDTMIFEPRMTGLVLVADPPNRDHLRLELGLAGPGPEQLLFWDRRGLSHLKLLNAEELERELGPERLGPDALQVTGAMLRERLGGSQRAVKVALLDQHAVAGIGNLYAAEILFEAEVDPRARCTRLSRKQWDRIAAATQQVLQLAIRYEGSTLADGTYRNALNQDGNYQNHHRVYAREGEPCARCHDHAIRRIVQAQRSTFFCAGCQKRR